MGSRGKMWSPRGIQNCWRAFKGLNVEGSFLRRLHPVPCAMGLEVWNLIKFNQNSLNNV